MSVITNEQMAAYHCDGYAIVRQMFDQYVLFLRRSAAADFSPAFQRREVGNHSPRRVATPEFNRH